MGAQEMRWITVVVLDERGLLTIAGNHEIPVVSMDPPRRLRRAFSQAANASGV